MTVMRKCTHPGPVEPLPRRAGNHAARHPRGSEPASLPSQPYPEVGATNATAHGATASTRRQPPRLVQRRPHRRPAPAHAPRAPLNARLATVAKPASSSRSASSRWAMRSAEAGRASARDAPAVHAPPAGRDQQRAGLAHQPDAERAALQHQAGPRVQLARLVADEVAEQPERAALGARRAARLRPHHVGAALRRTARGSPTRAPSARRPTGARSGSSATRTRRGGDERDAVRDRAHRPARPRSAARGVDARAPGDRARAREAPATGSPAGDRAAQDHEVGVGGSSRTCSAWPSPALTMAK